MKKLLLTFIIVFIYSYAYADVYVAYFKDTKQIYGLSEQNDIAEKQGIEVVKIAGTIKDLQIVYPIDVYEFKDNVIKTNPQRLSDYRALVEQVETKETQKQSKLNSAKNKLKNLGLTDEEIQAILQ